MENQGTQNQNTPQNPEQNAPIQSQQNQTPGLASQGETLEGYGRKFPFPKYIFLGIVFIILLIIAGAYFLGKKSAKETAIIPSPAPVVYQSPSPTPNPTADWKTYTNDKFGFKIKYPNSLEKYKGDWVYEEFNGDYGNLFNVGFGTSASKVGGYIWVINVFSDELERIISNHGDQFSDRKEDRKNVTVNGVDALLVTVTTREVPNWISKNLIIQKDNLYYVISNGAVDDSEFDVFYNSFEFTN